MAGQERRLLLPDAIQEKLAVRMYEQGHFGIKENPDDYITLKSGRRSPHYFDLRTGLSDPHTRRGVADAMVELALAKTHSVNVGQLRDHYAYFVGSPEAMTSYGASIADLAFMPLLQPRVNTSKTTGNKSPILGRYHEGDEVAAFDDVITDGATKIETIQTLGAHGLVVADYFVVLDREEGGAIEVQSGTGLSVVPALGLAQTVKILRANSLATQTQFDNVVEYMNQYGDPHAISELAA